VPKPAPISAATEPCAALTPSSLLRTFRLRGRVLGLLREAAAEEVCVRTARDAGLAVADAELQHAANRFRLRHGLSSAESTQQWLDGQQLTTEDWEVGLEREVLIEKFKDHLATNESAAYLATHGDRYSRVRLRLLVVPTEGLARELLVQVTEEGRSFEELAATRSADPAAGDLGEVFRGQLAVPVADAAFAARNGDVIGPFAGRHGFELLQVGEVRTPELDPMTAAAIREDLFADWIRERMVGVTVRLESLDDA
jgi:parvulin-like peptidyl-prolyl isomerase